mmetsp:Transcript_9089/g.38192  ORF Transcript_9089/g.38192 Transcript_9089/m.38192 type:complete len:231 (+) Transcript_9089:479-1171(+)
MSQVRQTRSPDARVPRVPVPQVREGGAPGARLPRVLVLQVRRVRALLEGLSQPAGGEMPPLRPKRPHDARLHKPAAGAVCAAGRLPGLGAASLRVSEGWRKRRPPRRERRQEGRREGRRGGRCAPRRRPRRGGRSRARRPRPRPRRAEASGGCSQTQERRLRPRSRSRRRQGQVDPLHEARSFGAAGQDQVSGAHLPVLHPHQGVPDRRALHRPRADGRGDEDHARAEAN